MHCNLAAFQADEEAGSRRSGSRGAPSPSRRSDPDLDITEIGDICSNDGDYGSGDSLNSRRRVREGGSALGILAASRSTVLIYIESSYHARARVRSRSLALEIKWGTSGGLWEGALDGRVCEELAGLHARWPDFSAFHPDWIYIRRCLNTTAQVRNAASWV